MSPGSSRLRVRFIRGTAYAFCTLIGGDRRGLLRLLYLSVFLVATAIGTPMMLAPVQAERLGATLFDIGIMGTAAAAVYTVMTLIAGTLLDRFEKVRLYLAFNVFTVGCLVYLALATDFRQVFIGRVLLGISGGAFWAAAGAITADMAPSELLTHAIGRYNLSWILGFVIGPFVGGWVADTYGYATLWWLLTAVMAAALVVNGVLVPRIRLEAESREIRFDFSAVSQLRWAYLTMIPYALGLGIYFYILPGYMAEKGLTATVIGFLLALDSAVKGVGFYYSERIVGVGVRRGMLAATVALAVSLVGVAYASSSLEFLWPLVLFGAANGVIEPLILDFIAHGSPRGSLGATMSFYEFMYGAFTCVSPIAAGYISQLYPLSTTYIGLGLITLLIIPASSRLRNREKVSEIHLEVK
jgi:predicted MFS family arabinose efflux permease